MSEKTVLKIFHSNLTSGNNSKWFKPEQKIGPSKVKVRINPSKMINR